MRSIPKNFSTFNLFLDQLVHKFSILGCSESWLRPNKLDLFTPLNYQHIYDIRGKTVGGGVSLYVCNTIVFNVRSDLKLEFDYNLIS